MINQTANVEIHQPRGKTEKVSFSKNRYDRAAQAGLKDYGSESVRPTEKKVWGIIVSCSLHVYNIF